MERTKTKEVSQRVEVDATPSSPVGSVSVRISLDVTPGEDRVSILDAEQVDLIVVKRTKLNSRKCEET